MPELADTSDEHFMSVALDLAARGQGLVEPNPMVGCVLVRDGRLIATGYHAKFGGPHAEIAALDSLSSGSDARGATVYVTLEPCCHQGKTPPCSQALIDAGVGRVVVAMQDPFGKVNGGGLQQLRDANIQTTMGVLESKAAALNAPYLKRVRTGLPYVVAKWAMTADGRIATKTGESKWITGARSRQQVHLLRGRVDAIIAGMGTVSSDDPLLTARPPGPRTATRVVFCRTRLPGLDSRLIQSIDQAPVTLIVGPSITEIDQQSLRDVGVQFVACPSDGGAEMVIQALQHLADQGATNVMIEGGAALMASFMEANQIDECHVYLGAKIFGGQSAPGPIGGGGVLSIADAPAMELQCVDRFDDDVRLIYRRTAGAERVAGSS